MKAYELNPLQRLFLESTIKTLETVSNNAVSQIIEELKMATNQELANNLIANLVTLTERSEQQYKKVFEEHYDFLNDHYDNFRANHLRSDLYTSPVLIDWLP